jgi:pyruvate dehydrogenase E1 component alpha subunit/2-oxoisovalerate dehydrogenase E1 component alpha subunit
VRLLGPDGKLVAGAEPSIAAARLLHVHDVMRLVRALDERMITLQRQGRAGFYGACTGEEAAVLGSAAALRDTDWIVPALRQNAAMLFRGFPLVAYVAQVLGNSGDVMKARQMPSHHAALSVRQVSWSSCIANQLLQAVGLARAVRYRKDPHVVAGFVGDGGTSEGEFHVAMNLAALWKLPLVLICQNNQWAISVPLERQTRVTRIADKATAYGLPGVRVDGNDVLAVHQVVHEAAERARSGGGPTFVELYTYRVGAHSTSDDPSRYRDESITAEWRKLDPVARLEAYLVRAGLRDAAGIEAVAKAAVARVDAAVREAEALPPVSVDTLVEDVYAEVPAPLRAQHAAWSPRRASSEPS